ncbi:uncharacterized protein LOC113280045 [Papaver somniferum]|uniref:uncharacterized protein LOC113280045 n=1 Tax=Papaver somniferum TaxID=3469 RepID=UPI000E6F5685|nr:uncharacterized protein LOC113280045 [Papaver somniferum]
MAFKVQSDQRPYNDMYDPKKYCKHYSREGHSQEGCFQLIGYPEWWGDIQIGGRGYGRGGRTGGRGRAGAGFVNSIRGRGQGNIRAHNLNISAATASHPATGSSGDASGLTGVTASQVQQVLEYLNSRKFSSQIQVKVLAVSDDTYELWHQRLGHPSEKVLQQLPGVGRLLKKNNDAVPDKPTEIVRANNDVCWSDDEEIVQKENPESVTENPEYVSENPEDITENPKYITENPEDSTENPEYITGNQEGITVKPENITENPEDITENPEDDTKNPEYITESRRKK